MSIAGSHARLRGTLGWIPNALKFKNRSFSPHGSRRRCAERTRRVTLAHRSIRLSCVAYLAQVSLAPYDVATSTEETLGWVLSMFRVGCEGAVSAFTANVCAAVLALPGSAAPVVLAQASPAAAPAGTLSPDELDSLVAPIALYPDPLLSQALVASTYPLEVVQLQQWLAQQRT